MNSTDVIDVLDQIAQAKEESNALMKKWGL